MHRTSGQSDWLKWEPHKAYTWGGGGVVISELENILNYSVKILIFSD